MTVNAASKRRTLNALADLVVNEDSGALVVNLSGISSGVLSPTVLVSATTGSPELLGNLTVNYTSGASGTLNFTPVPNAFGTGVVTVVVDNGGASNSTISRSFQVTVNPVNDAPTLDTIGVIILDEDSGTNAQRCRHFERSTK